MSWFVYIVQCADGTLYTGCTPDLTQRMHKHNQGQGAKYTRGRRPVTLLYQETWPDRRQAQQREAAIKKLDRATKFALCSVHHQWW